MELLRNGHHVILASDGSAKKYLETEFPKLRVEELPGYGITYPKKGSFVWHMAKKLPQIVSAIAQEKKVVAELIVQHQIDVILSDNRYGVFSKQVKSIIMTHQTNVFLGIGGGLVNLQIHKYLARFNEVWIPDVAGELNASGKLSHKKIKGISPKFMGILSRLNESVVSQKPHNFPFEGGFVLGMVSGPEPQRTVFENKLVAESKSIARKMVIVGGDFEEQRAVTHKNLHRIPFANTAEIKWLIENGQVVIARSGYSTIMDLIACKKPAILIPTPGQTEQEYVAEHLAYLAVFVKQEQATFNLKKALNSMSTLVWNSKLETLQTPNQLVEIINGI
ncbi:MAG: UDP-N-acetylglucosamine transferase subunit ALG13 [Halieaceae bacterium]|jgi:UDP-N-acetylglucosamine transferase subunit ALG13